ncbi:MAG: ExbD/TolR family protein [Candidatus Brocadiia bacterium]
MRARRSRRPRSPRIDLTPLLDTVFLVIVMLMCSFIHLRAVSAIKVERPVVATGAQALGTRSVLEVVVRRDGGILFEGRQLALEELAGELERRAASAEACLVSADREARHGRVTRVVVAARNAMGRKPIYFEVDREIQQPASERAAR